MLSTKDHVSDKGLTQQVCFFSGEIDVSGPHIPGSALGAKDLII